MIACLVTDRRRLAPAVDQALAERCLMEQVRFAVEAEVDLIQVRERDLEAAALVDLVTRIVEQARGSRTRIVVNERVDVALAAGAGGVHLRRDSLPVAAARRLSPPGFLVGRSVGSIDQARESGEADYLIAGTIWPSASKMLDHQLLGVEGLARIAAAVSVPVLAIGGITVERLSDVRRAGGQGVAAIGAFMSSGPSGTCRAMALRERLARLRASFDTPTAGS
jgi:thiamine-phosphate pyrophosphorylase